MCAIHAKPTYIMGLQSFLFVACRNMQLDDLVTQLRQDVTRFREAAE